MQIPRPPGPKSILNQNPVDAHFSEEMRFHDAMLKNIGELEHSLASKSAADAEAKLSELSDGFRRFTDTHSLVHSEMAASLAAACQTSGSHIERLDKLKQVYGRDKADWHEIQGLVFAAQLILNRPTLSNQAVAEAQKVLVIALEIANEFDEREPLLKSVGNLDEQLKRIRVPGGTAHDIKLIVTALVYNIRLKRDGSLHHTAIPTQTDFTWMGGIQRASTWPLTFFTQPEHASEIDKFNRISAQLTRAHEALLRGDVAPVIEIMDKVTPQLRVIKAHDWQHMQLYHYVFLEIVRDAEDHFANVGQPSGTAALTVEQLRAYMGWQRPDGTHTDKDSELRSGIDIEVRKRFQGQARPLRTDEVIEKCNHHFTAADSRIRTLLGCIRVLLGDARAAHSATAVMMLTSSEVQRAMLNKSQAGAMISLVDEIVAAVRGNQFIDQTTRRALAFQSDRLKAVLRTKK